MDIEQDVLGALSPSDRTLFLSTAPRLVFDVSCRMAILEGLTYSSSADVDAVLWAAKDPHPWVRRTYLDYICRLPPMVWQKTVDSLDWKELLAVNRCIYPGYLDLLLQAGSAIRLCEPDSDPAKVLSQAIAGLPPNEKNAVRRSLELEGILV